MQYGLNFRAVLTSELPLLEQTHPVRHHSIAQISEP